MNFQKEISNRICKSEQKSIFIGEYTLLLSLYNFIDDEV